MSERLSGALEGVRPLLRVRQTREFSDEPVSEEELDAIADAARWSGSAGNSQPWRFIVITERSTVRALGEPGLPDTLALYTARAAIASVLPADPARRLSHAYDDGRAAERMLIAASLLGLGAAINWLQDEAREVATRVLALPGDRLVRSMVAVGYPSDAARRRTSPSGSARLPRSEVVFRERWPG